MRVRLIATALLATLLAGPAFGQGWDRDRGFERERREPRLESGEGRDRPAHLDRRQRIERAEQRIRERNGRRPGAAGRRWNDGGADGIYRRSGNYRRW